MNSHNHNDNILNNVMSIIIIFIPLLVYIGPRVILIVIFIIITSTIWLCCILFQMQSPVTLEITPATPLVTALLFSSTLFVSIQCC